MSIAAAVVDVGWVNGLAAIRSLGRAGIRVLAVDHRPSALGFRSKYAEPLLSPDPFEDEHRFVNFIRALGEVVVFPTHDDSLNAIARYADDLQVLTPFPSWGLLEHVQSKRTQLERAAAAGVDVPAADPGMFPVIVKPDRSVEFKRRYRR
jgi:D-aspartate ligase